MAAFLPSARRGEERRREGGRGGEGGGKTECGGVGVCVSGAGALPRYLVRFPGMRREREREEAGLVTSPPVSEWHTNFRCSICNLRRMPLNIDRPRESGTIGTII